MKFKIISILVWICLAVVVCGLVYQFGPPGIKPGDDRVLSSMRLQNGDLLYIVAHRTTSIVDTYEVCLYRVNQNTNLFVSLEERTLIGGDVRSVQTLAQTAS